MSQSDDPRFCLAVCHCVDVFIPATGHSPWSQRSSGGFSGSRLLRVSYTPHTSHRHVPCCVNRLILGERTLPSVISTIQLCLASSKLPVSSLKKYARKIPDGKVATNAPHGQVLPQLWTLPQWVGLFNPFRQRQVRKDVGTHMSEHNVDGAPGESAMDALRDGRSLASHKAEVLGKVAWEHQQHLAGNKDPWILEAKRMPRAGPNRPNIVYTKYQHRYVACVDCMDDMHYINYILVRVNEIGRCRDCGNCFHLKSHPEPDILYDDPTTHFDH